MYGELALVSLIITGDSHGKPCGGAKGLKQRLLVVCIVKHIVVLLEYLAPVLLEHEGEQLGKLTHILLPVDNGHLTFSLFHIV